MVADIAYLQQSQQQINQLEPLLAAQRAAYRSNPMPAAEQRRAWLKALRTLILDEKQALIDAASSDFSNRAANETLLAEIMPSLHGIDYASKRLGKWMKPSRRSVGIAFQPASAKVVYQPLGVVGVIVPWNYPLYLAFGPLIGALAAGNRVMIKMSESTPATSQLVKDLLAKVFPADLVSVVLGEADVGQAFSRLPFDHLVFTGATSIGKHVMRAAADNLVPVTLELGGKSPVIISTTADLDQAALSIAVAKATNGGQICINPDLVYVPRHLQTSFISALRSAYASLHPSIQGNPDVVAVVNQRHLSRVEGYIDDARQRGARIESLPAALPLDANDRRRPLRLVIDPPQDAQIMNEEIFGPAMVLLSYDDLGQVIDAINAGPRPLALYYFGQDAAEQRRVLEHTVSGGVTLNDVMMHAAMHDAPFGGVGASGMGHYHGREGFLEFSHLRTVFKAPAHDPRREWGLLPPYGEHYLATMLAMVTSD